MSSETIASLTAMSRIDTDEVATTLVDGHHEIDIIAPRDVPLGGLRAMTVRRTLPNRQRTTIGPWCFLDHYGPDDIEQTGGMSVPPHPHTGLQTVSWLFEGTIEHQDSTGAHALVVPGELNIMTAGRGIQHSEVSTPDSSVLHGVQLWVALPEAHRDHAPHFDTRQSLAAAVDQGVVALITGELPQVGVVDAPHYWPMVAAQIDLPAQARMSLSLDESFEHGILVDSGETTVLGESVPPHHLAYLAPGRASVELVAGNQPARLVLIGGAPFEEDIVMWWNFIGRRHDDIEAAREAWQSGLTSGSERFGFLDHMPALPAPEMPRVTLKARPPGALPTSSGHHSRN